jgi:hypothetical protein
VVSERDRVGARREELLREARRQSDAVCGVLAVDNARVDVELFAETLEALLDGPPPGRTEDVGDEEQPQGDSVAAGRTSTATWLPASFV